MENEHNVQYFDSLKIPISLGTTSVEELVGYRRELEEQRDRLDADIGAINKAILDRSGVVYE